MTRNQIPNALTLLRVALVPVAVLLWEQDVPHLFGWLFLLFAFASVTDFLDGWLARAWNCQSKLGAMLDPLADKLLVATLLVMLVWGHQVPTAAALVIILREIFISGLRETLALSGVPLPVSRSGKWKTALQMGGISLTLLGLHLRVIDLLMIGHALIWISAALALVSAVLYLRASWTGLR